MKSKIKHLGIIMDGSRRFARAHNLPLFRGHEIGYEKLKDVVHWAKEVGVETIIAYAFSTENWKRSKEEVHFLMKLFEQIVVDRADELKQEKIRIKFIGQLERFPRKIREASRKLEEDTKDYKNFTLVIGVSYGGRAEIVAAIKKIPKSKIASLSEDNFGNYLWTAGLPDPELIIRTSGEVRTSNFLPWQSAYSEWFFSKTFWPAFTKREFYKILRDFSNRERRNGT